MKGSRLRRRRRRGGWGAWPSSHLALPTSLAPSLKQSRANSPATRRHKPRPPRRPQSLRRMRCLERAAWPVREPSNAAVATPRAAAPMPQPARPTDPAAALRRAAEIGDIAGAANAARRTGRHRCARFRRPHGPDAGDAAWPERRGRCAAGARRGSECSGLASAPRLCRPLWPAISRLSPRRCNAPARAESRRHSSAAYVAAPTIRTASSA